MAKVFDSFLSICSYHHPVAEGRQSERPPGNALRAALRIVGKARRKLRRIEKPLLLRGFFVYDRIELAAARHRCQPSLTWRDGEVVTRESAKLLCRGSIPLRASRR